MGESLVESAVGPDPGGVTSRLEILSDASRLPQAISAAVCSFDTLQDAVDTAIAVIQSAIPVARIELVEDIMMRGINRHSKLGYREAPTLFFEFHGSETGVA